MMNAKEHHARDIFIVAVILLMLACNVPINPMATPLGISDNIPATQVPDIIIDTLPAPVSPPIDIATETPTPTFTLTSTPTFTQTSTPTNSPTPIFTSIPPTHISPSQQPTPNFDQLLVFGEGGGGPGDDPCINSAFPPPVVFAKRNSLGAHIAYLCVYQIALPIDSPIHLSLTSPDGGTVLQAYFQLAKYQSEFQHADWHGFENEDFYSYAENCKEEKCAKWYLQFWWPANLPVGAWQLHLDWNGGEAFGTFETYPSLPELSVYDGLVQNALRPGSESMSPCHPVANSVGLTVAGRGFPPNNTVYVPVFENVSGSAYRFLSAQTFIADSNGVIFGALSGTFQSGKRYALAGVIDSTRSLLVPLESGEIRSTAFDDAIDCFCVP